MKILEIIQQLLNKNENFTLNRKTFKLLAITVVFFGVLIVLNILFPRVIALMFNAIWIVLLAIVCIFFGLGALVIIGLRKEASKLLDILLEGSLTFLEAIEFLKLLYQKFITLLKEFLLYAAPVIAYTFAFILYVILLVVYKSVGRLYDVAIFTMVLTAALVIIVGILNRPQLIPADLTEWKNRFISAFKSAFIDGFEVVLFIFFLTMDSTNLFFLPEKLNVLLSAQIGNYNLMVKGFSMDGHLKTTLNLVIFSITIEIIRNGLKLIAATRIHYANILHNTVEGITMKRIDRIKKAARNAFADVRDEMVRFITFTTVLFAVFMFFPRLKLLALAVTSAVNFILDFWMRDRLAISKGTDLVSRVLSKVFRV